MNRIFRMFIRIEGIAVLGALIALWAAVPALAGSRSHSVDVSCIVKPVFQISSPVKETALSQKTTGPVFKPVRRAELGVTGTASGVAVRSNQPGTRVTTEIRKEARGTVKLHSVTVI